MQNRAIASILMLLLAGCAPAAPVALAPSVVAAERTVTATGYLTPRGSDGRLLAVVSPWTAADIDHVVLTVSVGGSTVGTLTIPHASLSNQVTLTNLKLSTNYSILAQAYNTSDASAPIDNSSVLLSSCTTTFSTTNDSAASIGPIALQLTNKTFAGSGANTLQIGSGSVVNNANPLGLGLTALISTLAGTGSSGFSGDGGAAVTGALAVPLGVALDASGNVYVGDVGNNRVRKVDHATGFISTFAGSGTGTFGGDGGAATGASLQYPAGVAVDGSGNLYIADTNNQRIRKVTPGGIISTVAGNGSAAFTGDGPVATGTSLNLPTGVAVDASGNLFIADQANHRIRKVTPGGAISTVAGTGSGGYNGDGIAATSASLNDPYGVAVDASGNLYIADQNNHRVRKVTSGGIISTLAGTGSATFGGDNGAASAASLHSPNGVAVDGLGNVFIADSANNRLREIDHTTGVITTIAGTGAAGYNGDGGAGPSANLYGPYGVAVDPSGTLLIADTGNNRVRKLQ